MPYTKQPDPNSKPVKYLTNRIKGMNKSEAQLKAGYKDVNHGTRIEATKTYQKAIGELLLPEEQVAKEHNKIIAQDDDKGSKNRAIDMYYKIKKLYPSDSQTIESGDVSITLRRQ